MPTLTSPVGLRRLGSGVLDLLPLPRCPHCDPTVSESVTLCAGCWCRIVFLGASSCVTCGYPFDFDAGSAGLRSACIARAPQLDLVRHCHAVRRYQPIARHGLEARDPISLNAAFRAPQQPGRGVGAGDSQAGRIAGLRGLFDPATAHPISRIKNKEERRHNDSGALAVCRTADLRGKALVLIDDELTTGATVEDCWRVLKRAGAGRVKVLTLARGALVKLMAKKEEYGQG